MVGPRSILIWVAFAFAVFHSASSIQLDTDGGYHLRIAIDPNLDSATIGDVNSYINNIRSSIQLFSIKLWEATEGRFFVKSTELLVPNSWTLSSEALVSISQSFESSDIKLSAQSKVPFVQNPNPCGVPGDFIQLPANFFQNPNTGGYGVSWKVLLNQWARYRWGVWEEHGYPHSSTTPSENKFPYFYQTTGPENSLQWTQNTCSNTELVGKYENVLGDACTIESEEMPDPKCRFVPDPSQNHASTSLMSFHWLDSVTKFCNKDNHNKHSPNAQNWFCNYKSIMEVMAETPDYELVSSPLENQVPIPELRILKANNLVPFYLVVDRGFADSGATTIVSEVIRNLVPLYDNQLPKTVLTAFGTFPGESNELVENISWKFLGSNEDEFFEAIGHVNLNGPTDRNFGTALEQVAESIGKLNSANGAVVLLIKTEATPTTFDSINYEDQLLTNLLEKKIKLFTIEIPNTNSENPQFALESLSTRVGGMHLGLDDSKNVEAEISPLIEKIVAEIENPTKHEILISYSGTLNLSSTDPISINVGGRKSKVHFGLTLRNDSSINAEIDLDGSSNYLNGTRSEWNMPSRYVKSIVHSYKDGDQGLLSLKFSCTSGCNELAYLIITEELVEPLANEIQVTVSTSADASNKVDLNGTHVSELSPFSIYTKVETNGKPVSNLTVTATLTSATDTDLHVIAINLLDDGLGVPDVARNDGIYSNVFIPPSDGTYSIIVKVEASGGGAIVGTSPSSSRLLPVDQVQIGCGESGCESVSLPEPISVVRNLGNAIQFSNVAIYPNAGKPTKILDMTTTNDPENRVVRFEFTSPKVLGSSTGKATKYIIKGARSQDDFFTADGTQNLVNVLIHEDSIQPPGSLETLETPLYEELYYFAIFSYNGDKESSMSPVIRILGKPIVSEEPSTTTTTSPGVSSSSTEDPGTGTGSPLPTSSTEEPVPEEKKPFFKTAGGIVLIVFLVLGGIAAAGGGFWYYKKKQGNRSSTVFA